MPTPSAGQRCPNCRAEPDAEIARWAPCEMIQYSVNPVCHGSGSESGGRRAGSTLDWELPKGGGGAILSFVALAHTEQQVLSKHLGVDE